jgi:hypothetical protein
VILFSIGNTNSQTILAIGFVLILGILICRWIGISWQTEEEEVVTAGDPEAALQQIAEYRTYMVNQWLCLLSFWLNIKPEEAKTKLLTPNYNQNVLYFYYENLEVAASFFWDDYVVVVKTSVYKEDGGYIELQKTFKFNSNVFDNDGMYKFIQEAINAHHEEYELTEDDMIGVIKQLKIAAKGFESEDAAREHLFNYMADLIIVMRQKKNRTNKKLTTTFAGLMFWLWNVYGDEFLKFLDVTEEEFLGTNNNENEEKTEGNE